MKHEDMSVAEIAKERAAKLSNISRCFNPALGSGIKFSKTLQRSILFFIQ